MAMKKSVWDMILKVVIACLLYTSDAADEL